MSGKKYYNGAYHKCGIAELNDCIVVNKKCSICGKTYCKQHKLSSLCGSTGPTGPQGTTGPRGPTGRDTHVYNDNGSLTGQRIIDLNGYDLTFDGNNGGDVIIDGKLTVTGLIDPIGLILDQTNCSNVPTGIMKGAIYVSDGTDSEIKNHLIYIDETGNKTDILVENNFTVKRKAFVSCDGDNNIALVERPDRPFNTIQTAINAVNSAKNSNERWVIVLYPGSYGSAFLRDKIDIIGCGESTCIEGIRAFGTGLSYVKNVKVEHNSDTVIDLYSDFTVFISDSTIRGNYSVTSISLVDISDGSLYIDNCNLFMSTHTTSGGTDTMINIDSFDESDIILCNSKITINNNKVNGLLHIISNIGDVEAKCRLYNNIIDINMTNDDTDIYIVRLGNSDNTSKIQISKNAFNILQNFDGGELRQLSLDGGSSDSIVCFSNNCYSTDNRLIINDIVDNTEGSEVKIKILGDVWANRIGCPIVSSSNNLDFNYHITDSCGSIWSTGGHSRSVIGITGDYMANNCDNTIVVSDSNLSVTLPDYNKCKGKMYIIKNGAGATNTSITNSIDGNNSYIIEDSYGSICVQSTDEGWLRICADSQCNGGIGCTGNDGYNGSTGPTGPIGPIGLSGIRGPTGPGGLGSTIARKVYVSSNGNDATGIIERIDMPFLTAQAAINAANIAKTGSDRWVIVLGVGYFGDILPRDGIDIIGCGKSSVIGMITVTGVTGSSCIELVTIQPIADVSLITQNSNFSLRLKNAYIDKAYTVAFNGIVLQNGTLDIIDSDINITTSSMLGTNTFIQWQHNNMTYLNLCNNNITVNNITQAQTFIFLNCTGSQQTKALLSGNKIVLNMTNQIGGNTIDIYRFNNPCVGSLAVDQDSIEFNQNFSANNVRVVCITGAVSSDICLNNVSFNYKEASFLSIIDILNVTGTSTSNIRMLDNIWCGRDGCLNLSIGAQMDVKYSITDDNGSYYSSGGVSQSIIGVTGNYVIGKGDYTIVTQSSSINVTLPDYDECRGRILYIKNDIGVTGTNIIGNIDNTSPTVLNSQYDSICIQAGLSGWIRL